MTAAQTKARRLADSISRMDTFTEHQRSEIQKAAAIMLRQDELLGRVLEAMEEAHDQSLDGMDFTCRQTLLTQITAIRTHREAK